TSVAGALTLYALGLWVPWRWLAIAGGVPALLMVTLLCCMPSSPRRLLSLGREEKAEQALRWAWSVLGWETVCEWLLATPVYYKPILISVGMRFLQQMTGITPILIYLQTIFAKMTHISSCLRYDAALVGAVRLVSVLVAACLMDKAGRKALLYTSSMLMFLSSLTLTITSHTTPCPNPPNSTALFYNSQNALVSGTTGASPSDTSLIPVVSTMVFILGEAMGWGPITWLLMSEVLPLAARGVASGLCVTVSWLTAFALTHAFTHLLDLGLYVPYLLFTVVCVLCLLFNAVCIPETRGRSLEEIENYFRTGRSFTIGSRSTSLLEST
uniref:Solute carrier family 2 member 6 n=1 Tax=Neogobius melanostomus TaxID=47308 RepID=A0A8C6TT63_9GOBI